LSLFPLSYEHDIEEDASLPKVLPPYLPPKANDSKPYTLVLDLDETLIHFEEVSLLLLNILIERRKFS
jgi:hypothetical protein